ncbi:hypothetical protein N0V93_008770 [Gnomoniopsis smithogilvyi]|uniref:methylated diphthine methylhydrolase n=1 Tax=Gnomoniopsis smithogilvyi TaxID=1191159 RepID=A0A9W8YPS1_9PEZI|nr:hypothetical protein N0V93_008770 [Gnomoniopsis smithogilvyi]
MSASGGESISSTQSMILDLPPSCIEFCPAHPDLFVVGTYNLENSEEAKTVDEEKLDEEEDLQASSTGKQPQSRNGSIILFQLREGKVYPIQTISQPSAVFDLHFQPHPGKGDVFATVSSTGTISVFKVVVPAGWNSASPVPVIDHLDMIQPISVLRLPDLDEDVLFTYFAWHPSIPGLVAITTASGQVILVQIHKDYQSIEVLENPVLEHSLEAWVVAFSQPTSQPSSEPTKAPFTIFSGGDDSALKYTTYDPSADHPTPYSPITLRGHTAGVTAILPLALPNSHIVLTGSYDDTIRVFAIAPLHTTFGAKQARPLAECSLGGGVWRLSVIGEAAVGADGEWAVSVLASCMHAGTRVLRIAGGDGGEDVEIEVLGRFEEHKSMNYGSDWARVDEPVDGDGRPRGIIVSTSFYDRLLCVWSMSKGS